MAPPSDPASASASVLLAVHAAVRPLGAGPDAEAQLRKLQLSTDPERPGRFRLELLGAGPGAVSGGGGGARPGPVPSAGRLCALEQFTCPCFRFLVCRMGTKALLPTFRGVP